MNIKIFAVLYLLGTCGSLLAASPRSVRHESPQPVSRQYKELRERSRARLEDNLKRQEDLQQKLSSIGKSIEDNIQRKSNIESYFQSVANFIPREEREAFETNVTQQISALEKQLEQLKHEQLKLYTQLESAVREGGEIQRLIDTIEQDRDIITITEQHERQVPWDGILIETDITGKSLFKEVPTICTSFANNAAKVCQIPALGQARSIDDQTNYCGYYAVYNAMCLLHGGDNIEKALLDRAAFSRMFFDMLHRIKAKRQRPPYDNLAEDEIDDLLRRIGTLQRDYMFVVLTRRESGWVCNFTDASLVTEATSGHVSPERALIKAFKAGQKKNFVIIFNVGAHWVTIKVQRDDDGMMRFMVVDSLNRVKWTMDNIIQERLVPLYNFIAEVK
jgi:hypothetical protein